MDKFFSMLGLCRRAGKLAVGRDAVTSAVKRRQTSVVFLTSDASDSHRRELTAIAPDVQIRVLPCTMAEIAFYFGRRSCVFAATDLNFTAALEKLI